MAAEEAPSVDLITLTRHVLSDQLRLGASATGDLTLLLTAIQVTSKFIATNVRKARLINLVGLAGETNVQGEEQKKLDVLSNDIMVNALRASGKTAVLVSEELEDAIIIEERNKGAYCVVFDPLDGSSNIDAGVNIGTIFGIYRVRPGSSGTLEDVLRPGSEMVAAGYTMYGSSANLVLSTGSGVNGYTLDAALGEFILTHPNIQIPHRGKIYSFNEGNSMYFHPPVTAYLKSIKYPAPPKTPYSARYIGSMVADVHRTLLYGGIFGYPSDKKSKSGKLRLLYEAFPMAFLTEQAGGIATTGTGRILDIVPKSIHERCPVFLGSRDDVQDLMKFYKSEPLEASKPRTNLKISIKRNPESTQSATPEPSVRKRVKRRVISDEEDENEDQEHVDLAAPSSPPALSARPPHTDENYNSEAESATPEPEPLPFTQPASSSRLKKTKGRKSINEPPPKKKRVQQEADSDDEYDAAVVSEVDETLIVNTKRQSKPTAKAKANKGKRKLSIGERDESQPSRPPAISKDATSTKRPREASKADDDQVDVVGDADNRQSTRSPSPAKEPSAPPAKRRKYPTITKNKAAGTKSDTISSKTGSITSVKPSAIDIPELPKPIGPLLRVPHPSGDFDLRNQDVYNALFKQPGSNTPRSGLTRQKEEEKRKEMNRMRDEARAKRMAEMTTSFDLQTEFEKIKSFEDTMRLRRSHCIFPNVLAAPWRHAYDEAQKEAAEEAWSQTESGQREEGELHPHRESGP